MAELHHGGRLREAAERFSIPLEEWLDLSTGINPVGWPVPELSPQSWQRLPESDDGLEQAACRYYKAEYILPVAGSQAAIQMLPQLRPLSRIGILAPGYAEHAAAWRRHGHEVIALTPDTIERQLPALDVLLLINPNNPTGVRFCSEQLLRWYQTLSKRGGWLVVDEAFIDAIPEHSLAAQTGNTGLIVLRSLGKFFGLAGARVGFVLAWPGLLTLLSERLGPWAVSGPAREVARRVLSDEDWQHQTRFRLQSESKRLGALLQQHHLPPAGSSPLFQYCPTGDAKLLHRLLAQQGILTRLFVEPQALRFGLPGSEAEWRQLSDALARIMNSNTAKASEC